MRLGAVALAVVLFAPGGTALAGGEIQNDGGAATGGPLLDPAPFVVPEGVYYVTETYVGDVVARSGSLTTYSTATIHESTGSWARVLETVATGAASAFDGAAFNGRMALSDGRAVAGTYYENLILGSAGLVPVSIVFFQDDSELARLASEARRVPSPAAASRAGSILELLPSRAPGPECCSTALSPSEPRGRESRELAPSVRVAPARVEVLRGRPTAIWLRAIADGREARIRSWRLIAGEAGRAQMRSGTATTPFLSAWDRLAPPGGAYELRFAIDVESAKGIETVEAPIAVIVRSPALTE